MSQSISLVSKLYQTVIDDVIANVRESFVDEGVDEQVLQELKQLWETKLSQSKAVEPPEAPTEQIIKTQAISEGNRYGSLGSAVYNPYQMVTVQINIPLQQGVPDGPQKSLNIQVPASALQGGATQLQAVLSTPAIQAALALPSEAAVGILQQHINAAIHRGDLTGQQQLYISTPFPQTRFGQKSNRTSLLPMPSMMRVARPNLMCTNIHYVTPATKSNIVQIDGPADSSEDDDGEEEEEDDDEDDKDGEDKDTEENDYDVQEEEPLNSEDDVSDEDLSDLFDTENVVVAQYDKITRSRNKWKFHLKDGIMNLKGKDYVFQKAGGDAEW